MGCQAKIFPVVSHRGHRSKIRQNYYRASPSVCLNFFKQLIAQGQWEERRNLSTEWCMAGGYKCVPVKIYITHEKEIHRGLQLLWQKDIIKLSVSLDTDRINVLILLEQTNKKLASTDLNITGLQLQGCVTAGTGSHLFHLMTAARDEL